MRNLDLDQFWPMPSRTPTGAGTVGAAERSQPIAPPPLRVPPALPAMTTAHEPLPELDAPADLIMAASAGWIDPEPAVPVAAEPPPLLVAAPPPLEVAVDTKPLDTAADIETLPHPAETAGIEPEPAKRRDFTPVIWGCTGFAAGMLAWHVIGFWSFVSNVVLNANDPRAQTLEAFLPQLSNNAPFQKAPAPVSAATTPLVQQVVKKAVSGTQFACVALAIDRAAGGTKVSGCKGGTTELRDAGFNKKTDKLVLRPRLQDPVAWTGSTAVQVTEAAEQADEAAAANSEVHSSEAGTLSEADLKLDLTKTGMTIPHEPD